MAIADAQYKFLYVDGGCNGRVADGGVFNRCSFARAMNNNGLNLPNASPLRGREMPMPYMLVADDAFAMRLNLIKPFPGQALTPSQRIFNYRFSRARRVVENSFGLLSAQFRVFRKPIHLYANKTKRITLACCALHNFLIERNSSDVQPIVDQRDIAEGLIANELENHNIYNLQDPLEIGKLLRKELEQYFMSAVGEVSWQYQHI